MQFFWILQSHHAYCLQPWLADESTPLNYEKGQENLVWRDNDLSLLIQNSLYHWISKLTLFYRIL